MTRIYTGDGVTAGLRVLILGAGHYPYAQASKPRVPKLEDITSAARSAVDFANHVLSDWQQTFCAPLLSVDLLVNDVDHPGGMPFTLPDGSPIAVDAPTIANIRSARTSWLDQATQDDTLIFYCCGHGIWLPSVSRTFLASDFGVDDESVWPNAVSLTDMTLGLGDKKPRQQWLMFDCCANTPPEGLRNARPAAEPLVSAVEGVRKTMTDAYGPLAQSTISASTEGESAYGKPDGRSRFMDVFIDACSGAGFIRQGDDGLWSLTLQGLEDAMTSYCWRVAAPQDRDYYTFSRLTSTDAAETPRLMARATPPECMLLVNTDPAYNLKTCTVDVMSGAARVDGQNPGPDAKVDFLCPVNAYGPYRVVATWPAETKTRDTLAFPPLTKVRV